MHMTFMLFTPQKSALEGQNGPPESLHHVVSTLVQTHPSVLCVLTKTLPSARPHDCLRIKTDKEEEPTRG